MKINIIRLHSWPILKQLQLEESLLRADEENWCLINQGSPPAIVLGISGKPEIMINTPYLQRKPIPVIRRFSGGGTVVVDESTYFITLICNSEQVQVPCQPEKILRWTEGLYQPLFGENDFRAIENDYVIKNRKCGGNAQYLRKNRWLHHTSFLWDYREEKMEYLQMPPKAPSYRSGRPHADFICRLRDYIDLGQFQSQFIKALKERYDVKEIAPQQAHAITHRPHRKATILLEM